MESYRTPIGIEVFLDEYDESFIRRIANDRTRDAAENNRQKNAKPKQNNTQEEMDENGAAADCVVAYVLDLFWPANGCKPDRGLGDAGLVEVKQTEHSDGHLVLRPGVNEDDIYVLVTGKDRHYVVRGFAWGWEVREHGNFKPLKKGWGPSHNLDQDKLHDIDDLIKWNRLHRNYKNDTRLLGVDRKQNAAQKRETAKS